MKRVSEMLRDRERHRRQMAGLIWFIMIYTAIAALIALISSKARAEDMIKIRSHVIKSARQYNVDPKLVMAIIKVESNFNPKRVGSSHGEIGLMQLHPKYFPQASFDVEKNIEAGVRYLAELKRIKGDIGCGWFIHYNVGPNTKINHPTLHSYYRKVAKIYPKYCEKWHLARN